LTTGFTVSAGIAKPMPTETVKPVVNQLKDKGRVIRGWLGVQIQPVTLEIPEKPGLKKVHGALIARQERNSPAAKAGIMSGDVITSFNSEPVGDSRDLIKRISAMAPGTPVKLGVFRKGEDRTITVTLGEVPSSESSGDSTRSSSDIGAPN
jgi:serine protease Do